ncbi:hypothetical protein E4U55_005738 [Claviceps digitariae]|nr:hypothetical protein E4U55_005738 [Claviceps digitariae]
MASRAVPFWMINEVRSATKLSGMCSCMGRSLGIPHFARQPDWLTSFLPNTGPEYVWKLKFCQPQDGSRVKMPRCLNEPWSRKDGASTRAFIPQGPA